MCNTFARVGMALAAMVLAGTTFGLAATSATPAPKVVAQASPTPSATPTPNPFAYRGYVRAYDFTRQNASGYNKPGTVNQQSFATALSLHGQYTFSPSGLMAGATYLYSTPFNGCANPATHFAPPCGNVKAPSQNPDDTLPGFSLSTLYEAYLAYQQHNVNARAGYQVVNTPWENPSDSRLKPVAFQGIDALYLLQHSWTLEGSYFSKFEERVSSNFFNNTLLTGQYADGSGISTLYNTDVKSSLAKPASISNKGAWMGHIGYNNSHNLASNFYYYGFDNIANAEWLDAKYTLKALVKPYVAIQIGNENSTGTQQVGIIDSQVYGVQGGVNVGPILITLGYDYIPTKSATITLPAGIACSTKPGSIHTLPTDVGAANYFLPTGGTPVCVPGPAVGGLNTATVYYGGWASPYTDSYATDVLFTTSLTQGMIDRRSYGNSGKLAGTYTSPNKKLVLFISRALYAYGNNAVGVSPTQETTIDGQYFFNHVPKTGPYKGLMVRYRYGERTINNTTLYGGTPLFKYNRAQLEYDF